MASGSHAGRRKFETSTIKERAEEYFPEMVEIRRDIHRHPEIGRNEGSTVSPMLLAPSVIRLQEEPAPST